MPRPCMGAGSVMTFQFICMTFEASLFRIHHFSKRETCRVTIGKWRFFARVVALVTEVALQIHYLSCIRRLKVTPVKRFLFALVSIQRLIPRQRFACLEACLAFGQHFATQDFIVAFQAVLVFGLQNCWLTMDWIPLCIVVILQLVSAEIAVLCLLAVAVPGWALTTATLLEINRKLLLPSIHRLQ